MMPKRSRESATFAPLESARKNFRAILRLSALLLFTLIGALASVAAFSQSIAFDQKQLNFNGNGSISSGTALQFGPDGLLYASQVNGVLKVFTIVRNETTGQYEVTDSETVLAVQSIPNHNDDGSLAPGTTNRQVTGLAVGGSAGSVEWYVTSSDSRIGGPSGDLNLDTNSGVITRLTRSGGGWTAVDIVRGLPRSEENHAPNGLQIVTISPDGEPSQRYLIVAIGGFTNAGSPSNNFAFITEYALSAAVLAVNLDMLESMPILVDPVSGRSYIYDLPTLDDPTRPNVNGITDPNDPDYDGIDVGDPWGGNDGLNMAMLVPDGPVQMFSPGYRNSYDLVVTQSGAVYVTDNGANGGWGGYPEFEATPNVTNNYRPGEPGSSGFDTANNEPQVNNLDHLNLVTTDIHSYTFGSIYGGHPTPVRANVNAGLYTVGSHTTGNSHFRTVLYDPNGTGEAADPGLALPANWPPVPASLIDVANADFRAPGANNPDSADPAFLPFDDPLDDITVTVWNTNTNGITEYTASNFGGQLQGALIAGHSGGNLHLVTLLPNGRLDTLQHNWVSGLGGNALGVTAQGDSDIFPGTIWVAPFNNSIVVLEPNDFVICILPGEPGYDPLADYDFDGFTNQDEIDNGTDHCSGASQPDDFDGDKISDLNDLDDDGDGIPDEEDPFQLGVPQDLPQLNELFSDQLDSNGRLFGYRGLGLTGLMNNGDPNPNWLNWIDRPGMGTGPNDILGGAIGAVTIQQTGGTAAGATNTQEKAFQYGVNVGVGTGPFVVESRMFGFNEEGQLYDFTVESGDAPPSQGIFIGTGFQDNYIEFILTQAGFTLREEVNDATSEIYNAAIDVADRPQGASADVILRLLIDPSVGTVVGQYSIDGAAPVTIGTVSAEGAVLEAIQQVSVPLAVGLIGTSGAPNDPNDPNDDKEFAASWDYLFTTGSAPFVSEPLPDLERSVDDLPENINLNDFFDDDNGTGNLVYTIQGNTNSAVGANISGNILTLTFPSTAATTEITVRATDADAYFVEQSFTVTVNEDPVPIVRINAGGGTVAASDGGPNWEANTATGATSGPSYTVNTGNIATHDIPLSGRHASIPEYVSDAEFVQLFANERWDPEAAPEMMWSIPVTSGIYEVRLYMGNGFAGTSGTNQRVFGVNIEGGPQEITGLDLSAKYGHQVGAMESYTVAVTDGVLNIEFLHQIENPLINAIEVLAGPGVSIPITVAPIGPILGFEGSSPTLAVNASGGDGPLNYAATGLPPGLSINVNTGVISGTVSVGASTNSPYSVTVTVDDSDGETSDAVAVAFTWSISASPDVGDVLFRINAGGPMLVDVNGNWSADQSVANANGSATTGTPSPFLDLSGSSADTTFGAPFTGSNPTGAPNALFETERYSGVGGTVDNLQYDIPLPSGDYIVNLYFAEIWTGAQSPGDRIFSVMIEGQLLLTNFDQTATYGWNNAGVQSFPVTVIDDNLDIDFLNVVENPSIKGIEVLRADMPSSPDAAAVVAINPGTGIDSSTFGGGFTITNNSTNGLQISKVTFNLSTALFPNMVFDPVGTAGDAAAKCFESISGAAETGLVTDGSGAGAGSCSAPFSNPRGNGGFDVLTIDFNDFDPGETFEFAVDIDPTSIEGATGTGDAGSVSGLELAGTVVSITFADGSTVLTGETYRIQPNSNGGSINTFLPTPLTPAPGLSIDSAVLAPVSLPGAQNATVPSLSPTVQISGPVGANVSLLVVQAERTVPVADLFEANTAVAVNEYDAVIGGSGTVNIPVTLSDSGETQLNYLAAVIVQPDGRTSNLSTIWRVNYDPQVAGAVLYRVNAGGRSAGGRRRLASGLDC
jgi:large repetitive protein